MKTKTRIDTLAECMSKETRLTYEIVLEAMKIFGEQAFSAGIHRANELVENGTIKKTFDKTGYIFYGEWLTKIGEEKNDNKRKSRSVSQ